MDNENTKRKQNLYLSFRIMSNTIETNMTAPADTQETPPIDCLADVMASIMDHQWKSTTSRRGGRHGTESMRVSSWIAPYTRNKGAYSNSSTTMHWEWQA